MIFSELSLFIEIGVFGLTEVGCGIYCLQIKIQINTTFAAGASTSGGKSQV